MKQQGYLYTMAKIYTEIPDRFSLLTMTSIALMHAVLVSFQWVTKSQAVHLS